MAGGLNKHWVRFLVRIFMRQVFTSPCTVLLLCDMLKDRDSVILALYVRAQSTRVRICRNLFFWSNVVFELRIFSPGEYCFQRKLRSYWDGARFDEIPSWGGWLGFIVFELFCFWVFLVYILQKCLESGGFGGFSIVMHGKAIWLFVVHSSRFVNVFVIKILPRAGGLFRYALTQDCDLRIYGYWCRIVSSMNMK